MEEEKILSHLAKKHRDIDLIIKNTTESTNTDARILAKESPDIRDTVIISLEQSGGRGRQGKSFISPIGGLYMSVLLDFGMSIYDAVRATSCAAVAVCRAIHTVCGIDTEIKWVNDIYINGGKLAGILTEAINNYESMICEKLIIGVGINLKSAPVCEGVEAVSLAHIGVSYSPEALASDIACELADMRDGGFDFSAVREEYKKSSSVLGHEILFTSNGTAKTGFAYDITENGYLAVRCTGEDVILSSGEISVRKANISE